MYDSRHHLFTMLEEDPATWQDETLGDKFRLFFKSFMVRLQKKELPSYFIKKQNLLSKLPKHKIAEAHAKVFRIQENIVPYLLQAVKILHYDKGFFPSLDCDFLIQILTTDNAIKLILPKLLRQNSMESMRSHQSK